MNRLLPLVASVFLFLQSTDSLFAQGGNTCAQAQASPITLPFNAAGSTCNGTDDYNFIGATCINDGYLQGNDWLYYFCATSTGQVQIVLTNMNPTNQFAS